MDSVLTASPEAKEEESSKAQREADRQSFLALLPTSWMTQEEIESALKILDQVRKKEMKGSGKKDRRRQEVRKPDHLLFFGRRPKRVR